MSETSGSLATRHFILLSRCGIGKFIAKSEADDVCRGHIVWLSLCLDGREEEQILARFLSGMRGVGRWQLQAAATFRTSQMESGTWPPENL